MSLRKVVIVGGHEQGCNIFEYIKNHGIADIVLCICRQDDFGDDGVFPSLLKRAREYKVPVLQPTKLNAESVVSAVTRLDPDLVLSLQNNMIFGDSWIKLFQEKLGIINVHYAPLPKYAGYWPEMWAIWNNEKEFGVTLHYVGVGIDTGPIISQRFFPITENENRTTLYKKSSKECFEMLKENLPMLLAAKQAAIEQVSESRSYFPKSLPNEGYLDLAWEKETQERFIRAISFPGFPGPKIKIGASVFTILSADLPFFKKIKLSTSEN